MSVMFIVAAGNACAADCDGCGCQSATAAANVSSAGLTDGVPFDPQILKCWNGALLLTGTRPLKAIIFLFLMLLSAQLWADVPATPVMTLYQFNGDLEIPYYRVDDVVRSAKPRPAGALTQGTAVIPCLVIRDGRPLTDRKGTPFVGFRVVMDPDTATPDSVRRFTQTVEKRQAMRTRNHHCEEDTKHVLNVRRLFAKRRAPFFEPPAAAANATIKRAAGGDKTLDGIIRAFHNSPQCRQANQKVTARRDSLRQAWEEFIADNRKRWPDKTLKQAKHLDYTLRTALFEGHLDRGCNAYGACERNVIALSIRNRARSSCLKRQGCRSPGDFQGVSSKVSQYNIWDEYLTQISGLTSCFLRDDLTSTTNPDTGAYYDRLQAMYAQSLPDVQRILFGTDRDLQALFPGNSLTDLKRLRHYYHAPAMGKCFPNHRRIEYMSGAVAGKGNDFVLVANTRIHVDEPIDGGYFFRAVELTAKDDGDRIEIIDRYPGFVVDGRKIRLKKSSRCFPYGIPQGCQLDKVTRYRRTPNWLTAGKPLALRCHTLDKGESCQRPAAKRMAEVGGVCDVEMRPVTGVN
jgi:hypothetical protein